MRPSILTLTIMVLGVLRTPSAFCGDGESFFSPFSHRDYSISQIEAEYVESAMAVLKQRIELARARIAEVQPRLEANALKLRQIAQSFSGAPNASLFYEQAAHTMHTLPERLQLLGWLERVESERDDFLGKFRQLGHWENKQELRRLLYETWLERIRRLHKPQLPFLQPAHLQSLDAFEEGLYRTALPLYSNGQITLPGLQLISVDNEVRRFLGQGMDQHSYAFLFASLSPHQPGDQVESTVVSEFDVRGSTYLRDSQVTPYLNVFYDVELISGLLQGQRTGRPLEVKLKVRPWSYFHIGTAPSYSARSHRLITIYGPYREGGNGTRWESASSGFDCAKKLAEALTPGVPWRRNRTENETDSEAMRIPK